jgi:hypothetical protein
VLTKIQIMWNISQAQIRNCNNSENCLGWRNIKGQFWPHYQIKVLSGILYHLIHHTLVDCRKLNSFFEVSSKAVVLNPFSATTHDRWRSHAWHTPMDVPRFWRNPKKFCRELKQIAPQKFFFFFFGMEFIKAFYKHVSNEVSHLKISKKMSVYKKE